MVAQIVNIGRRHGLLSGEIRGLPGVDHGEGEVNRVKYVLGLARNARLVRAIGGQMHQAGKSMAVRERRRGVSGDLEYQPASRGAGLAGWWARPSI